MTHIDWNQLEINSNSKEITFERFCYHYARIKFEGYGEFRYPYNAAGSEFYLELRKPLEIEGKTYVEGDVIGWQAKFWVNHTDLENSSLNRNHRDELKEGFKNTLKYNPKLALWIICTPGQFLESAFTKLLKELTDESSMVKIVHWHKAVFEEAFMAPDRGRYQELFSYYFSKKAIDMKIIDRLTRTTLDTLKQKFDIDLHTASPFENQLMGIIDKQRAFETVMRKLDDLEDRVRRYEQWCFDENGNRRRYGAFGEAMMTIMRPYETCILDMAHYLCSMRDEIDVDEIARKAIEYLDNKKPEFKCCAEKVAKEANKDEYRNAWEIFHEDILQIKSLIFGWDNYKDRSIYHTLKLREARIFPVFAQAGYGKTHFACSIANAQLKDGQPVLLLTGSRFRKCNRPQDVFLNLFGLEGVATFEELVKMLDFVVACHSASRMPIVIDGLNESFPNESVWAEELPLIVKAIEDADHLILVTTCREKTEYIQKIYRKIDYTQVENASFLAGIDDFNLQDTIHKYFRKYEITESKLISKHAFCNPLLLKIFCEVYRGSKGILVNEYSLAESMQRYSNRLVDNLSIQDGAVDKRLAHIVREGLLKTGQLLWERNTRMVDYFDDFDKIFGEQTEKLLDEGLCFQVDSINKDGGEVKFTYDLLAGYHIANYLLSQVQSELDLSELLNRKDVYEKLFGQTTVLHTLSEDIVKSLIFLTRERMRVSLFEVVRDDFSFAKILSGLEMISSTESERHSLRTRLAEPLTDIVKRTICDIVKSKIADYNSVIGISTLLPAFRQLSRREFDMEFHSRFLALGTLYESVNCVKKYLKEDVFEKDALAAAVLLTGCFDVQLRQEVIRLLVRHIASSLTVFAASAPDFLALSDPYIREAMYIVVHGAVVGRGNKSDVTCAVELLTEDLYANPTSHVIMLDCVDSLYDYAQSVHGLEVDEKVLSLAKDTKWESESNGEIWRSGVYDYDFEKFHIRPYSAMSYRRASEYTSRELFDMILWRMKRCGYDDRAYTEMVKAYHDMHYYYLGNVERIPFKHLETAQRELVGWLLLNNKAKPEYKSTFRTSEVEIDPSFPTMSPNRQLISTSFLPKNEEDLASWIEVSPLPDIKSNLCRILQGRVGSWVLLAGHLRQKNEKKAAEFYWQVFSGLAHKKDKHPLVGLSASSHSHIFASEIGWRDMILNTEDYYDPALGVLLMQQYEFSGWDSKRAKVPNFYFLSDQICKDFDLEFRVSELCYYCNGEKVTEYYQDSSSEFFYVRNDFMDEIMKKYKVQLVYELYSEKIDTHRKDQSYGWAAFREYKEMYVIKKI